MGRQKTFNAILGYLIKLSYYFHAYTLTEILKQLSSDEYYIRLAERMDQPPLKLSAVRQARVHPNPAEILQGYYSGAIKDWKAELVKYNTAMTNERDRAIRQAQSKGLAVSIDDWKFSNWEYGVNYTTDKY